MTDRRIQYMDLDKIEGALLNPKGHAEAELVAAIERWGFAEAPMLDERTGRLNVGHGRLKALRDRRDAGAPPPDGVQVDGDKWLVPVQRGWSSVDDDEAFAYLVAANQLTTAGGWQRDTLGDELSALAERGVSLDGLGFDAGDLADLTHPLDFAPVGAETQPQLDHRSTVHCPECGADFEPK